MVIPAARFRCDVLCRVVCKKPATGQLYARDDLRKTTGFSCRVFYAPIPTIMVNYARCWGEINPGLLQWVLWNWFGVIGIPSTIPKLELQWTPVTWNTNIDLIGHLLNKGIIFCLSRGILICSIFETLRVCCKHLMAPYGTPLQYNMRSMSRIAFGIGSTWGVQRRTYKTLRWYVPRR